MRGAGLRLGVCLLLILVVAALAAPGAGRAARRERPSLLLVTIDTLRRDRLGCCGHPGVETPNLDALARDGVVFEETVASSPTTGPSHATIFTALSPRAHGLLANGQALGDGVTTLAETLREAGYRTAAIVSSAVLARRAGLDRGFDTYIEAFSRGSGRAEISPAESTTARILPWLRKNAKRPFFLWVHYYDPHQPYDAPGVFGRFADPGYAGDFRAWDDKRVRDWIRDEATPPLEAAHLATRYDAEVAYVDAQIGVLLDALDRSGARGRTLVCVTSDHGETLGEHAGYFGHSHQLYDTTLLVPLIARFPGVLTTGRVETRPMRLIDLAPTLLALLAQPDLADVEGAPHPIARETASKDRPRALPGDPRIAVSESHPADRPGPDMNTVPRKLSIRTPETKLVRWLDADSTELFDLARDPGETRNLAGSAPAAEKDLAARLALWESLVGDAPALDPLDEETRERLRSLGYIE